jgi:glutamyl-tRNA reductase
VRERFSLSGDRAAALLRAAGAERAFPEALVLDTCNRTEVYLVGPSSADPLAYATRLWATAGGCGELPHNCLHTLHGLQAAEHLFEVAASLDSQIIGEQQILGQVKDAYRLACELKTTRTILNRLLHAAFRVGKRVQTETRLARGASSVPQAAVELARSELQTLEGRHVLLIGAGSTAQLAAQAAVRAGASEIAVVNRSHERAEQVAAALLAPPTGKGAAEICNQPHVTCPALAPAPAAAKRPQPRVHAAPISDLPHWLRWADLVISSTGSQRPVLTYELVHESLAGRRLLLVDIAMPRDIEAKVAQLPNVRLCNLDDLEAAVQANLKRRQDELPAAREIVQQELRQFGRWLESLDVAATIKLLRRYVHDLRQAELSRLPADAQASRLAQSLCNKILHKPMEFLKDIDAGGSDKLAALDLVHRMFDLDSLRGSP